MLIEKCAIFLADGKGLWQKLSSKLFLFRRGWGWGWGWGGRINLGQIWCRFGVKISMSKMYDAKFNIKRHIWANEDELLYHFAL